MIRLLADNAYDRIRAGMSMPGVLEIRDDLPIGPWAGLAVLAAWSAASLLCGALVVHHRDP